MSVIWLNSSELWSIPFDGEWFTGGGIGMSYEGSATGFPTLFPSTLKGGVDGGTSGSAISYIDQPKENSSVYRASMNMEMTPLIFNYWLQSIYKNILDTDKILVNAYFPKDEERIKKGGRERAGERERERENKAVQIMFFFIRQLYHQTSSCN